MAELETILKRHKFGKDHDSERDKRILARVIDLYLNNHPAVTTIDLHNALAHLEEGGLDLSHIPSAYLRQGANYTYVYPSNPHINGSEKFRYLHVNEAIALLHGHTKDDVVIHCEEVRNIASTVVYFRSEEELRKYLLPLIKGTKTVIHCELSFDQGKKRRY